MEFNIKKGSTLPFIEVAYLKDGNKDYNFSNTNLSESTIYFYMKNIDTDTYKIAKSIATYDSVNNKIYYQFTKKNTSDVGRYEGEFKVYNEQGLIELPLKEKIYINVLPSFSDSRFCCGSSRNIGPVPIPTQTPIPTPTPTPTPTSTPTPSVNGFYYGKFNSTSITSGDVVSNLTFVTANNAVNSYVPFGTGLGYGYTIIPTLFTQPTEFIDSTAGCTGIQIPTNNIGQVTINNINNVPVTYNVYRTFFRFNGTLTSWMCD
jgi:hypothetical protein